MFDSAFGFGGALEDDALDSALSVGRAFEDDDGVSCCLSAALLLFVLAGTDDVYEVWVSCCLSAALVCILLAGTDDVNDAGGEGFGACTNPVVSSKFATTSSTDSRCGLARVSETNVFRKQDMTGIAEVARGTKLVNSDSMLAFMTHIPLRKQNREDKQQICCHNHVATVSQDTPSMNLGCLSEQSWLQKLCQFHCH